MERSAGVCLFSGWLAPEEMLIANSGMDVEELSKIRELFDVSAMLDLRVWIAL
jgi:hypothetical protein